MMSKMNRIEYIDIAKAIVITLMVLGHSSIPARLSDWIFSFHMPFFFIISGVMTNWDKYGSKQFVIHKAKTLMIPFCIYSFCNILIYNLYGELSLSEFAMHLLQRGWEGYALWFVPILFLGLCLARFVVSTRWSLTAVLFLWLIAGMFDYLHINLPWTLSTVPIATSFIIIGARFSEFWKLQTTIKNPWIIMGITLCGGAILSLVHKTDLAWNHVNPMYVTVPAALFGFVFIMLLSKTLCSNAPHVVTKWVAVIGRETFLVLAFSQCIIKIINANTVLPAICKYALLFLVMLVLTFIKKEIKNAYIYCTHSATKRCS